MYDLRELRVHVTVFTDRILNSDRNCCNFFYQTFVFDVSKLLMSFSFPELLFSILFPRKNMKTKMALVFTDRFRLFSPLGGTLRRQGKQRPYR